MGEMRIVGVLVVVNRVKRNILQKSPVVGVLFVVFLVWGCASPPRKTMAPEPLVNEIKPIEGTESTVSSPTPPPTTRKVEAKSPKGGKTLYTVKKGDTLWRISNNYGVSVQAICKANHINSKTDLEVGQKIIIPSSGKVAPSSVSHSNKASLSGVKHGTTPRGFVWPVKGEVISPFGAKKNGVKNIGIGILPQSSQKVVASKKGAVEAVSDTGNGKYVVIIKHDEGCRTFYEGCSNPVVGENARIEQGQPIALIGGVDTGQSQELIFKIYVKDRPVNPMSYLP
ncbi:MAG: LysM peptidoglycan-binding domain-containing protein [Planctomycetota bacterium]